MDSPLVISIDKAWAALHNALGRARRRHRTESDDAQYTQASMPVGLFLSSAPSLQPNPHASAMSFQLPQPRPRRIVRMPLPFASITSQGPPAATSASVPALVRTGTQPANSAADRQPSSTSAPREEPQERILISEVGVGVLACQTQHLLICARPLSSPCAPAALQVEVVGCDGELKDMAKSVLKTRPNFAYTINEACLPRSRPASHAPPLHRYQHALPHKHLSYTTISRHCSPASRLRRLRGPCVGT